MTDMAGVALRLRHIGNTIIILGMKHRAWLEKVKLVQFLRQSGTSTLAGAVYHEQVVQGWPGLAMEVEDICKTIEMSNVDVRNSDIKNAISKHHAEELRGQMGKKLKNIMTEEIGKPK